MKRRGWIVAKLEERTTAEVLGDFFDRVERVLASRLGAGWPITDAFDRARWTRELEGDLLERPAMAGALVDRLERRLEPVTTIAELRSVLAGLVGAGARLAYIVDEAPEHPSPHVLYRLFSKAGALLYVGITDRGPRRWVEHERAKAWFGSVARFEIERLPSREAALESEGEVIARERPLWNVIHNPAARAG